MSHYKASSIESVLDTIRYVARWPRNLDDAMNALGISRATFLRHLSVAREIYTMQIIHENGTYQVIDYGVFDRWRLIQQ